ncbi:MAG: hypothetical protein NZ741_05835, partial [Armatimonadetes bacterium]|nr:hypothetical protein [Armatimonadota bacterium]
MGKALLNKKAICPICGRALAQPIGEHLQLQHSEQAFVQAVLNAKRAGMSDAQIGELFGVSFKQLE